MRQGSSTANSRVTALRAPERLLFRFQFLFLPLFLPLFSCPLAAQAGFLKLKAKAQEQAAPQEQVPPSAAALESQKLLKSIKTPFGAPPGAAADGDSSDALASFTLSGSESSPRRLSLADRLVPPQLYLPGHMTIGKTAQFTVKGKPGSFVALAMADKNTGARPVLGHKIRLGADRKVVAAARIPDSGVAVLNLDTPIDGDLIGQCLYFEAALWSKEDMSDTEIASVVPSESQPAAANGVLIAADNSDRKKGIRIVPDSAAPILSRQRPGTLGLESGKP